MAAPINVLAVIAERLSARQLILQPWVGLRCQPCVCRYIYIYLYDYVSLGPVTYNALHSILPRGRGLWARGPTGSREVGSTSRGRESNSETHTAS